MVSEKIVFFIEIKINILQKNNDNAKMRKTKAEKVCSKMLY